MKSPFEEASSLYDTNCVMQADMLHLIKSSSPDVSHSVIDKGVALRIPHSPDLFCFNQDVQTEREKVKSLEEGTVMAPLHHLQSGHASEEKKMMENALVQNVSVPQNQVSADNPHSVSLRKLYQLSAVLHSKPIKHEQTENVEPMELCTNIEDNEHLQTKQCKTCNAWMITKDFSIWLRGRQRHVIRWKRAKCNQCLTKAAIEYDEEKKHFAKYSKYQHQSACLTVENPQELFTERSDDQNCNETNLGMVDMNQNVVVLCPFCDEGTEISFYFLEETRSV